MNTTFIDQGKLTFQVLLIVLHQCSIGLCQFNLYDTDQRFQSGALQFDCLNYYVRRETLAYQELSDIVDEVIPYCFRSTSDFNALFEHFDASSHAKLSFKELSLKSISAQQLLSWSVSIEVIERYQMYLTASNTTLNEYFYNCTPPRFGLRCQYSFEFGEELSFNDIVAVAFHGREAYRESSQVGLRVPCYVLLKCHRHGQSWCLDWREVCDGVVDCFDEGTDEESCFDLEMNECGNDEFRCHNGMCISEELWEDGKGETDCLDRSDRATDDRFSRICFQDPTFLCEEHSCRPSFNPFSCSDGQCVNKFQDCPNGRHMLLLNSMSIQGNLTNECWTVMMCLTRLVTNVNGTSCDIWLMDKNSVEGALQQCESFFSFPTVPVHSNHVYLFYKDPYLTLDIDQFLSPDYICYNEQLCGPLGQNVSHEGHFCLNTLTLPSQFNLTNPWPPMISLIGQYFRSCSIFRDTLVEENKYTNHSSLYQCRHSTKLISKDRIMDGLEDCRENDDENFTDSCQLNNQYRVICADKTKCWSPLVKNQACGLNNLEDMNEIRFENFCDGIEQYFYNSTNPEYNDESGCEDWLCNHLYVRCDGYWSCKDGRDENSCAKTKCPVQTYPCVSSEDYTDICLPANFVNDEFPNCTGSLDEQWECRAVHFRNDIAAPYRCLSEDRCLPISQICDQKKDCLAGDDEDAKLCESRSFKCDQVSAQNRSSVEEIFCGLRKIEAFNIKYFSVRTCSNYPVLADNIIQTFDYWPTERDSIKNSSLSQVPKNQWPWFCHRGLALFIWLDQ